jgi:hypothetical protein
MLGLYEGSLWVYVVFRSGGSPFLWGMSRYGSLWRLWGYVREGLDSFWEEGDNHNVNTARGVKWRIKYLFHTNTKTLMFIL